MKDFEQNPPNSVLSVSQLNRLARNTLEDVFSGVVVEGEISDLLQHRSGHWYLTLKDEQSQIRVAMFRNANSRVKFAPENGQLVQLKGQLSVYEARGSYQFIAATMQPAGAGKLQQEFERLKKSLSHEGIFAQELKQELPVFPKQVAMITSPQGAAIRDMLTTFKRRNASVELVVVPVAVQGDSAAEQIARMLDYCNQHSHGESISFNPDVIIIGRGGGSLEDLWAFNEEIVARAIARSQVPIVSAVGHETDFTIADLAADVRAATPTAAAELACPDASHILSRIDALQKRIALALSRELSERKLLLASVHSKLEHPAKRIEQQSLRLDYIDTRLTHKIQQVLQQRAQELNKQSQNLTQLSPVRQLEQLKTKIDHCAQRQSRAVENIIESQYKQLDKLSTALNIVSPLSTIHRGFSITQKGQKIVRSIEQIEIGDTIETKLRDGTVVSVITGQEKEIN